MKKIIFAALLITTAFAANAQSNESTTGFDKKNIFTGGNIQMSFSSGGTVLGISPTLGYSLNKYLDAGVILNFTYTGYTDYSGDKYREYDYGPGLFARFYPINFLFLQANVEHNIVSQNYFASGSSSGSSSVHQSLNSNSFLIGGGYCSGRRGKGTPFFYLSIMVDVTKDPNSPYVQQLANNAIQALPIIKGGIQIPLFQERIHRHSRY